MRRLLFAFSFILYCLNGFSADLVYPASEIPDSLKTDAYAVIRKEETIFSYNSKGTGEEYNYLAITVLNKNGDRSALFLKYYDKFSSLSDIKITIYDASGKKIKKVKSDDIIDNSAVSGYSLYDDNRLKVYEPIQNTYPYTVVYEYTYNYKGIFSLPGWMPQTDNNISVQKSTFTLKVSNGLTFRTKEYNCTHSEQTNIQENTKVYSWEANNIKAFETESYMPRNYDFLMRVVLAPNDFELDGRSGNMETWQNLGKWIYELNIQNNTISEKTKNDLRVLTQGVTSNFEKIKLVYKYLQDKTRYVSIQMGIGGLKSFDASVTDQFGYGDCKALSNYMQVLLKEIGINSIYTCVFSGDYLLSEDYNLPRNLFNHVKLTVPLEKDTLFLECTSQYCPFGYSGRSTTNRPVLLITPEGGKLIKVPGLSAEQNLQSRKAVVNFDNTGMAKVNVLTLYKGLQYDNIFSALYESNEEQKKWLYRNVDIPNIAIKEFLLTADNMPVPVGKVQMSADVADYLSISNKRVFLPLNFMNRNKYVPSTSKPRRFKFELTFSYVDADTIDYILPTGLRIENIPANTEIITSYGEYKSKTIQKGDTIQYIRVMKMNAGLFPATEFTAFAEFMKKVVKADGAKVALLRN